MNFKESFTRYTSHNNKLHESGIVINPEDLNFRDNLISKSPKTSFELKCIIFQTLDCNNYNSRSNIT